MLELLTLHAVLGKFTIVKIPSSFLSRVLWACTEDTEDRPANTGWDKTPPQNPPEVPTIPINVMRRVMMVLVLVLVMVLVSHMADNIY